MLEVRPPPVAVRVSVVEAIFAAEEAVRVSVSALEVVPETEEIEAGDQAAVTPVGKPLTAKAMLPLKEPSVAAVRLTALFVPCATLTEVAVPVRASVGVLVTVNA